MTLSGKLWLKIIVKVTKKLGFILPLENTFVEKTEEGQVFLGLSRLIRQVKVKGPHFANFEMNW